MYIYTWKHCKVFCMLQNYVLMDLCVCVSQWMDFEQTPPAASGILIKTVCLLVLETQPYNTGCRQTHSHTHLQNVPENGCCF